jgi:hypothetical protein
MQGRLTNKLMRISGKYHRGIGGPLRVFIDNNA